MKSVNKLISYFLLFLFFNCGSSFSKQDQIRVYNYYVKKANALNKSHKYKEALSYSNSAIEITDTISGGFKTKGISLYNLNLIDDAIGNFNQAISLELNLPQTFKDKTQALLKKKDIKALEAIETYLNYNSPNDEVFILKKDYYNEKLLYDSHMAYYSIFNEE